jgi:hypothetical protein
MASEIPIPHTIATCQRPVSAPVSTRYFRRSFTLDEKARIESARVLMTADNSFQLWVNGRKAGEHFDKFLPFELDLTGLKS